jgi:hypothetical protein
MKIDWFRFKRFEIIDHTIKDIVFGPFGIYLDYIGKALQKKENMDIAKAVALITI